MKNLAIIPSFGAGTYGRLIAAGPLTKQPGTKPFRTVIVQYADESLSVHDECFQNEAVIEQINDGDLGEPNILPGWIGRPVNKGRPCAVCHPSYLHQGSYFKSHQLVEATQCFAERLTRLSMYLESIYREEVTA